MRPFLTRRFAGLTRGQVEEYNKNGFLVLPKLIGRAETDTLRQRALTLLSHWEPPSHSAIFTTVEQHRQSNAYFLSSSEAISFFLEEGAQDPASGLLLRPKHESVNKIAHAMHDLDQIFSQLSYRKEYREILRDLAYLEPVIVQSMYIMKPPRLGGVVVPHQDSTYIISDPPTCMGIWLAVEKATKGNACLYAIPGSHKQGTLKHWVKKGEDMVFEGVGEYSTEGGVCVEAEQGTVVLLHGDLVHWSEKNESQQSRHAYTLHVVETQNCTWSSKNWLQRSHLPFKSWPLP